MKPTWSARQIQFLSRHSATTMSSFKLDRSCIAGCVCVCVCVRWAVGIRKSSSVAFTVVGHHRGTLGLGRLPRRVMDIARRGGLWVNN